MEGLENAQEAACSTIPQPLNGKNHQGGLPKEVGMKEEEIYVRSILFVSQVTKLLLRTHQCEAVHCARV